VIGIPGGLKHGHREVNHELQHNKGILFDIG